MRPVTPLDIKRTIHSGEHKALLVDIRDESEFLDWNIRGSINLPVNHFVVKGEVNELKRALKKLPKDAQVITVCTRGINSQVAASILRDIGYNATFLEGGLRGWNTNFEVFESDFGSFKIAQFLRVGKGCLSYAVFSEKTRETAFIDTAVITAQYFDYIKVNALNPVYVIDTHSHADHFSGAFALAKDLGVDYYINSADVDSECPHRPFDDRMEILLGDVVIKIIETPGHTNGSLSFLIDGKALLCGDLLLLENAGRPDLARTKQETVDGAKIMFNTIQKKILTLPDSVRVFPCHVTTSGLRPVTLPLGELKKTNQSLSRSDEAGFINYVTENIPVTPPNFDSIKKFNKAGVIVPVDYAEDLEIGPNRCAAR